MADPDLSPKPLAGDEDFQNMQAMASDGDPAYGSFDDSCSTALNHATSDGCRICGDATHFARDCPDKKDRPSGCFNCGADGHMKSECPEPPIVREFAGKCHNCGESGHPAAKCTTSRMSLYLSSLNIATMDAAEAFEALKAADADRDIDEVKTAVLTYVKATPGLSWLTLEDCLRSEGLNTHLIAMEQDVGDTRVIIDLAGETGPKYVISFQFSSKPRRAMMAEGWPKSPEENQDRLKNAGVVIDGRVAKCFNCGCLGHLSKDCSEEKEDRQDSKIVCVHCNADGHWARDCPEPRRARGSNMTCHRCGGDGHRAKDCNEERNEKRTESGSSQAEGQIQDHERSETEDVPDEAFAGLTVSDDAWGTPADKVHPGEHQVVEAW